ncbi:MAG: SocA family protein [Actinobacteria bacterium]|nr:SocA family protein [Actinomycetota bacterium]
MTETQFKSKKFNELIVYIACRLGPEAALGRVKLAKLLMASDFGAYERFGQSITGATYEKWEQGHLPRELTLADRDLEAQGAVAVQSESYFGKTLKRVTALRDPDMSEFSEDELAVIEIAIHQFGHETATRLSELSHQEVGWRLAAWREEIPYRTVFLGKGEVSEADLRRGEELASSHGWN